MEVKLHTILTSALDRGEQMTSCLSHFIPKRRTLVPTGLERIDARDGQDMQLLKTDNRKKKANLQIFMIKCVILTEAQARMPKKPTFSTSLSTNSFTRSKCVCKYRSSYHCNPAYYNETKDIFFLL